MRDNAQVSRECGPGWEKLILPILAQADQEDATVQQVKEKFGKLRIYCFNSTEQLDDLIDQAERDSGTVCEMCGEPGRMMLKGGWYKTLCADDALNLGYKTRV